ncbi:MAG: hypothetical protein ACLR6J_13950 [Parabacteroides merdae]
MLEVPGQWQTCFRKDGHSGRCRLQAFHASRQVFAHADALGDKLDSDEKAVLLSQEGCP